MSAHTPGPWTLQTVPTSGGSGSCHKIGPFPSAGVYKETHACVYADAQRMGIDESNAIATELRANARLIARAPDMYAALEECLEYFEERYDVNDGDYGVPEANKEMQMGQMIEVALGRKP